MEPDRDTYMEPDRDTYTEPERDKHMEPYIGLCACIHAHTNKQTYILYVRVFEASTSNLIKAFPAASTGNAF